MMMNTFPESLSHLPSKSWTAVTDPFEWSRTKLNKSRCWCRLHFQPRKFQHMESQCESEGWSYLKGRLLARGNPGGLWLENILNHFSSSQDTLEWCLWKRGEQRVCSDQCNLKNVLFPSLMTFEFICFQLIVAAVSLGSYPSTSQHLDLFLTSQLVSSHQAV